MCIIHDTNNQEFVRGTRKSDVMVNDKDYQIVSLW